MNLRIVARICKVISVFALLVIVFVVLDII